MTRAASTPVPGGGRFRRALVAVGTFLQSMDHTSFDYTLDRIERLEREVRRLREELRRERGPGDADGPDEGGDPVARGAR